MVNSVDVAEYLKNATLEGSGLVPILECGAATGITGLVAAGIFGTLRSPNPAVFAAAKGTESFLLGSFFWFNRSRICNVWHIKPSSPPEDQVKASATAGGITGGVGGAILRNRYAIIPATLVFSLLGYAGQKGYNYLDARHTHQSQLTTGDNQLERKSIWQRTANSKYSPMKVLSDEEYEKVLREKLVRVEAEIALIDEDIDKIQAQAEKLRRSS